jgi:hypothetical protein
MPAPIDVFFSYSHKDEALRDELETHLKLLERAGMIRSWHDRCVEAGQEWQAAINDKLEKAHVILLLVSADFLASDYCYDVEMKRALARHEERAATVLPVILRDCNWSHTPFANLQVLPKDAKPITSWSNRDKAWTNVVAGIEAAVAHRAPLIGPPEVPPTPADDALQRNRAASALEPRALVRRVSLVAAVLAGAALIAFVAQAWVSSRKSPGRAAESTESKLTYVTTDGRTCEAWIDPIDEEKAYWKMTCGPGLQYWLGYKGRDGGAWWAHVNAAYDSESKLVKYTFEHRGSGNPPGNDPRNLPEMNYGPRTWERTHIVFWDSAGNSLQASIQAAPATQAPLFVIERYTH